MVLKNCKEVLNDLKKIIAQVDQKEIDKLKKMIYNSERLFFAGTGRSMLMIKGVAMRFMQFGFEVYIVGETNTPSFKQNDLLIAASGSGETKSTILYVKNAKKQGGKTAVLTAAKNSTIAQYSDQIIEIPINKLFLKEEKLNPGGSYFEETILLLGDSLIVNIAAEKNISTEKLFERHANLE